MVSLELYPSTEKLTMPLYLLRIGIAESRKNDQNNL